MKFYELLMVVNDTEIIGMLSAQPSRYRKNSIWEMYQKLLDRLRQCTPDESKTASLYVVCTDFYEVNDCAQLERIVNGAVEVFAADGLDDENLKEMGAMPVEEILSLTVNPACIRRYGAPLYCAAVLNELSFTQPFRKMFPETDDELEKITAAISADLENLTHLSPEELAAMRLADEQALIENHGQAWYEQFCFYSDLAEQLNNNAYEQEIRKIREGMAQ